MAPSAVAHAAYGPASAQGELNNRNLKSNQIDFQALFLLNRWPYESSSLCLSHGSDAFQHLAVDKQEKTPTEAGKKCLHGSCCDSKS